MFGGGNVKFEATVTIDISKTDIPCFSIRSSVSLSVCLSPSPSLYVSTALAPDVMPTAHHLSLHSARA